MTNPDRTAAAREARHLNALRRKAPAMVEALRELGYTVTDCPGHDVQWGTREEEASTYYCGGERERGAS